MVVGVGVGRSLQHKHPHLSHFHSLIHLPWNDRVRELTFERERERESERDRERDRERETERKERRERMAHLQTKRDAIGEQVGFGREHVRTDRREKHARHVWVHH